MTKTNINGVNLYYEVHGKGKPLVLIAGFSCRTDLWELLLPYFTENFQVLIFDNRGVGQSDAPDSSLTIEDMAADTLALIDQLQLQKPHILGHSMGGAIAQMIAKRHPEKIDKVVLANSLIKFNEVSRYVQNYLLKLRLEGVSIRRLAEYILPWLCSGEFLANNFTIEAFLQHQESNPYPQTLVGYKRQLEALTSFNSSSWVDQITNPTLVIEGQVDLLCPLDSQQLAKAIKGAQLYTFEGQGHLTLVEKPQEFSQVVTKFLT